MAGFGGLLVVGLDDDRAIRAHFFGSLRQFNGEVRAEMAGARIDRHTLRRSIDDNLHHAQPFALGHGNKLARRAGGDDAMRAAADQDNRHGAPCFFVNGAVCVKHGHGRGKDPADHG